MPFSQMVIDYTVSRDAAYMLDEMVARITYDSDREEAGRMLMGAAPAAQPAAKDARAEHNLNVDLIRAGNGPLELRDIEQVAHSIAGLGLTQPAMAVKSPDGKCFDPPTGHPRPAACRTLGWKTIAAVVMDSRRNSPP